MLAAGSAAATDGPSTADVAAEVIRQLRSQGLVMRGADQQLATQIPCPSEQAIPPASAQPAISRVVAQLTGEERHTSISQPLDLHVDTKIKARIQTNEFIELNTLTISPAPIHQPEQYSLQITGNNLQVVPKQKISHIRTLEQWTSAFHIFVTIYTQAHPFSTSELMKYASTIDTLAKRSGFGAAMFYDTTFRKWKQHQPSLGWGNINNELYIQTLTIGMQSSAPTGGPPSPFPPSATQDRPRCCFWSRSRSA